MRPGQIISHETVWNETNCEHGRRTSGRRGETDGRDARSTLERFRRAAVGRWGSMNKGLFKRTVQMAVAACVAASWCGVVSTAPSGPESTRASLDAAILDRAAESGDRTLFYCNSVPVALLSATFGDGSRFRGMTGVRRLVAAVGRVVVERGQGLAIVAEEGDRGCLGPMSVASRHLRDERAVGREDEEAIARALLRNSDRSVRTFVPGPEGIRVTVTYWRATPLGDPTLFLVCEDGASGGAFVRLVRISRKDRALEVANLWKGDDRGRARTWVAGTVVDVLQDVDGDGVLDVVVVVPSRDRSGERGLEELVFLSGRTGEMILRSTGYEFVVARERGRGMVLAQDGVSTSVTLIEDGRVERLLERPMADLALDAAGREPIHRDREIRMSSPTLARFGIKPEAVLEHFVRAACPESLPCADFTAIRAVRPVKEVASEGEAASRRGRVDVVMARSRE